MDPVTVVADRPTTVDLTEDIFTAGLKGSASLLETPQSISVIPRGMMDLRNNKQTAEALRYSAGITTDTYGFDPRGYEWINIRGFDSFNSQYLDGMRLYNYEVVETFGLERIELLRGPSSVLFGQSTPGGLINNVSKKPVDTRFGQVGVEVGTGESYEGTLDFGNVLLGEDTLSYRLTSLYRNTEEDPNGNEVNSERIFVAPAVTWKPTEDTTLTVLSSYQRWESAQVPEYFKGPQGFVKTNNLRWDSELSEIWRVGYQFEQKLGEQVTFRQNARYSHYDSASRYFYINDLISATELDMIAADYKVASRAWTIDNQVEWRIQSGSIKHTLLAGLDYGYATAESREFDGPAPTLDLINPVFNPPFSEPDILVSRLDQTVEQLGIYAQDHVKIGDHLVVVGSIRHDWATTETEEHTGGGYKDEQDDKAFSYRLGTVYLLDNGLAPYASFSTSFFPNSGVDAQGTAFDPTESTQYEVGLKYAPKDFRGGVTLSAFHLTQDNVLTTDPRNQAYQKANGEWTSKGIELEGNVGLTEQITVLGSLTLMDIEITKSNDGDEGKTPGQTPEKAASGWVTYSFTDGALKGLTLGSGIRYTGSNYQDTSNTAKNDELIAVDLVAQYVRGPWTVALNVDNVADETSYSSDGIGYYESAGRTVRLSLSYRW
ncbi:TonB-dependent siderophore receptor [Roseimicrobium sp. ORNL1]|uniref:TonB-dependent siderophore receptor n=1 Tax=Roseimicrobium sp. ORNL1 TaxID=2711231 RepID=UPI0013E16CC6|nr:TonB-dependent siderophore receptor [Roseimicrobium sp. ORNL1]QIF04598.1 TonB-dependent siderophore receptor [Roseimicrobium sp. ORNL1]